MLDHSVTVSQRTQFRSTRRGLPRFTLACAAALAVTACAPHRTFEDEIFVRGQNVADAARWRTFACDEPVELKTTGALAVEVESFGGDITIHIVSVEGQKVRVAIHAPKDVPVVRDNAVVTEPKEAKS
jgi:hypothetical protein